TVAVVKKDGKPIAQTAGPFAGCYFSPTALIDSKHNDERDLERYVDSSAVAYIALPHEFVQKFGPSSGLAFGDLGLVYNPKNGRVALAIFGDEAQAVGGSAKLADDLGLYQPGERRAAKLRKPSGDLVYLIFPKSRKSPAWPYRGGPRAIERDAASLLEKWG